jgi:ribosome biogenesis GTPase A
MALVAGMPNCGKSTLINAIRGRMQGRKAEHGKEVAKVGSRPGVTRHVSSFRVGDGNWGPLYMVSGRWADVAITSISPTSPTTSPY